MPAGAAASSIGRGARLDPVPESARRTPRTWSPSVASARGWLRRATRPRRWTPPGSRPRKNGSARQEWRTSVTERYRPCKGTRSRRAGSRWAGAHGRCGRPPGPGAWCPRPRVALVNALAGDDAGGRGAGGQRDRGGGQLGQVATGDGEDADGADPALIDKQGAAVGAEAGVDRADAAGGADRRAAQQGQRPAGGDRVAGDGAGSGVHGEQEPAVMADLNPARGRLQVREGGGADRRQRPVGGVAERRDGAAAGRRCGRWTQTA